MANPLRRKGDLLTIADCAREINELWLELLRKSPGGLKLRMRELVDGGRLAAATDGQLVAYTAATDDWGPVDLPVAGAPITDTWDITDVAASGTSPRTLVDTGEWDPARPSRVDVWLDVELPDQVVDPDMIGAQIDLGTYNPTGVEIDSVAADLRFAMLGIDPDLFQVFIPEYTATVLRLWKPTPAAKLTVHTSEHGPTAFSTHHARPFPFDAGLVAAPGLSWTLPSGTPQVSVGGAGGSDPIPATAYAVVTPL